MVPLAAATMSLYVLSRTNRNLVAAHFANQAMSVTPRGFAVRFFYDIFYVVFGH